MRVGIDAQPVSDVRASLSVYGERYSRRLFTPQEASSGPEITPDRLAQRLAARFAAKEAVLKALQVADRIPDWTEIEVLSTPGKAPRIVLHGTAEILAREAGLSTWEVSLTHTDEMAIAMVVAA